jgi:hypothetical protein
MHDESKPHKVMICPPPTKINKILKLKQTENT